MSMNWLILLMMLAPLQITPAFATEQAIQPCALPLDLQTKISSLFPGTRIVGLGDLVDADRKFYQADHGNHCPGAVRVDFYGDQKPTWAIALISETRETRRSRLLVAHLEDSVWSIRSLESMTGTPVVWKENPGQFRDVYGEKTIHAKYPVIVLCFYEASAIVYSWNGKKIDKVWISD